MSDFPSVQHDPPITLHRIGLLALTLCGITLGIRMIAGFIPALTWSIALAVVFHQPYLWLSKRTRSKTFAALLVTAGVTAMLVVPLLVLAGSIGHQTIGMVDVVQSGAVAEWITSFLQKYPTLNRSIEKLSSNLDLRQGAQATAGFIGVR
ncbi:MAG: hypothetical protein ABI142_12225, partial [Bryocella sp.]